MGFSVRQVNVVKVIFIKKIFGRKTKLVTVGKGIRRKFSICQFVKINILNVWIYQFEQPEFRALSFFQSKTKPVTGVNIIIGQI